MSTMQVWRLLHYLPINQSFSNAIIHLVQLFRIYLLLTAMLSVEKNPTKAISLPQRAFSSNGLWVDVVP